MLPSPCNLVKHPYPYRHQLVGEVKVLVVQRRLVFSGTESEKCAVVVLGEQAEVLAPREGLRFLLVGQSAGLGGFPYLFHRLRRVGRSREVLLPTYGSLQTVVRRCTIYDFFQL